MKSLVQPDSPFATRPESTYKSAKVVQTTGATSHARAKIERWRKEYDEERPKKSLGGLPPAVYAKQLAAKTFTMNPRL